MQNVFTTHGDASTSKFQEHNLNGTILDLQLESQPTTVLVVLENSN